MASITTEGNVIVSGSVIANGVTLGAGGGAGSLYTQILGDGSTNTFVITHNLGTRDVFVSFRENGDNYESLNAAWEATTNNSITVNFGTPPTLNSVKVLVYGSVSGAEIATLNDISDVNISSATPGQFLKWDGENWINGELSIGQPVGVTDNVTFAGVTAGNVKIGVDQDRVISTTGVHLVLTTSNSEPNAMESGINIVPASNTSDNYSSGQPVNIYAGTAFTSGSGTSQGGSVIILGGNASGGGVNTSGGVGIDAGTATAGSGSATNGSVTIGTYRAESITIGRTGKTTTVAGNMEVSGTMSFQQTTEKVNTSSISANVMTCNYTTGAIYYQSTNPSANFTVNFTNIPTTNERAITFTIFVTQGATAYLPNAVQIDGSAQTIKWAQGTTPTPTANKIDIFSFTLIRLSSSWTVFGNANTNF